MWQMWNFPEYNFTLISRFLNTLYPSRCPQCLKFSDVFEYSPICSSCWSQIKKYSGTLCKICAEPFSSEYAEICGPYLKNTPPFTKVFTYGLYEGILAEAINQFKFHAVKRLSKSLGKLLFGLSLPHVDCIVPVPLTIKRLRERGFNQSLLIARIIAKETKIPLLMDVLLKKKDTLPQLGLSAKERVLNIKNAFESAGNVKGLRILLVDDVMTTGATVRECSRQLLDAFAQEVFVLTIALARFQ